MAKNKLVILMFVFLASFELRGSELKYDSLSCSRNGTEVLYFGGEDFFGLLNIDNNRQLLDTRLREYSSKFDAKSEFEVKEFSLKSSAFMTEGLKKISDAYEATLGNDYFDELQEVVLDTTDFCKQSKNLCLIAKEALDAVSKTVTISKYTSWSLLLRERIRLGKKVIVITSGMGNDLLAFSYAYNPLNLLLDQKDRKSLGHLQIGESFFGSQFDIKSQFIIRKPGEGGTHYNDLFSYPDDVTDFQGNYLSTRYKLNRISTPKGRANYQTSNLMLVDLVEELAWNLGNNDQTCCDGEDGRFYRKDLDTNPLPLFVSLKSKIDQDVNVVSDNKSYLCGEVTVSPIGAAKNVSFKETKIKGPGKIFIKGNVTFDDVVSENYDQTVSTEFVNSDSLIPQVISSSNVIGPNKFSNPLFFFNSSTAGSNTIAGSKFTAPDGNTYVSSIIDSEISNGSKLQGYYSINDRDLSNTKVNAYPVTNFGAFNAMYIVNNPRKRLIENSNLNGFGWIAGEIKFGVNLNSYQIQNVIAGVNIQESATIEYADLSGALLLDGNTVFSGSWDGYSIKEGMFVGHSTNSSFYLIDIDGAPRVLNSSFQRGKIFEFNGKNPYIDRSHFPSALSIFCDAYVYNESQIRDYGCGYSSPLDIDYTSQIESFNEIEAQKAELLEKNRELVLEHSESLERQASRMY